MFINNSAGGLAEYQSQRSLRLRASASANLTRVFGVPTSRKIMTFSFWAKRGSLGGQMAVFGSSTAAGSRDVIGFFGNTSAAGDSFHFRDTTAGAYELTSTAPFRDPTAWYHFVISFNTTQATASNRVKMYVNGQQLTSFAVATYPALNFDLFFNVNTALQAIGQRGDLAQYFFDGYLNDVYFIDGQELLPTSFAKTDTITGAWVPKQYVGTYGATGYSQKYNNITSTATLGNDSSGNGNTWTVNNVSLTAGTTYDSMIDVPLVTGGSERGNYATMNVVGNPSTAITYSEAALKVLLGTTGAWRTAVSTAPVLPGDKVYWEVTVAVAGAAADMMLGIVADTANIIGSYYTGIDTFSYGYCANVNKYINGVASAYGAAYTTNDVIAFTLDLTNGQLTAYKNNVSQGLLTTVTLGRGYFPAVSAASTSATYAVNFGQRPFAYTPPSGFRPLHTANLPTPSVVKPIEQFVTFLYAGNLANSRTLTVGEFDPGLIWFRRRDAITSHALHDWVRGNDKRLSSDLTAGESAHTGYMSFGAAASKQVTVSYSGSAGNQLFYNNTGNYVAWAWRNRTTPVSNTNGTITSQVAVNADAGMSIVTYAGTLSGVGIPTIGHGLASPPELIISRSRSPAGADSGQWIVRHPSLTGPTYYLPLNTTAAEVNSTANGAMVAPTSTVFSSNYTSGINVTGNNYIAYCWHSIPGYSRFGRYAGNGAVDGPMFYCGFLPALVIIRRINGVENWYMFDNNRDPSNPVSRQIQSNTTAAEVTATSIDFLATGFKVRSLAVGLNAAGSNYLVIAFAAAPFKYALAR